MNGLEINNLLLTAGSFTVGELGLQVRFGEYFMLMGHTGAGKSLLMKAVCGLHPLQQGSIAIHGKEVTNREPRFRGIGYVPQNSGLLPHLDVRDNIGFALDILGVHREEAAERTATLAEELGITALLDRRIDGLSGGERQKVSLARALARRPRLLLLDEPVSALDEQTRSDICALLKRVHREHGITTIHICHNHGEAEQLGDRIGIMNAGTIVAIHEGGIIS